MATNLSSGLVLDAEGNLVLQPGRRGDARCGFEEAGELAAAEWPEPFATAALEDLPVGVALFERRPVHTIVPFTGADGVDRSCRGDRFPLVGREESCSARSRSSGPLIVARG